MLEMRHGICTLRLRSETYKKDEGSDGVDQGAPNLAQIRLRRKSDRHSDNTAARRFGFGGSGERKELLERTAAVQ